MLESRFAPFFYDDPHGALFKLLQRGSINDYLTEFERLANRTVGLAPPFLLSCFISGLNPDLRREVQAFQPMSLPQVVALAKLQEDKLQDRRKGPRSLAQSNPLLHPYTTNHSNTTSHSNPSHQATHMSTPVAVTSPNPNHKLPIKRLSPEALVVRRDRGLCYHCDEQWTRGHRCNPRLHLLIADDDEDSTNPSQELQPNTPSAQLQCLGRYACFRDYATLWHYQQPPGPHPC